MSNLQSKSFGTAALRRFGVANESQESWCCVSWRTFGLTEVHVPGLEPILKKAEKWSVLERMHGVNRRASQAFYKVPVLKLLLR